jgi:1,2-dihydroxy-3-keto-5-methylthiopentene dioxygenase
MEKEAAPEMTTLTIYRSDGALHRGPVTTLGEIVRELAAIGIPMERWPVKPLPEHADQAGTLAVYAPEIDRLNQAHGFVAIDVIHLEPSAPNKTEMRQKFLAEHTHDDDEVRYFLDGSGAFYVRNDALVYQIICTRGDLISVPRGTKHWFDTGAEPAFRVIRFFTNPKGWIGNFTGDDIATRVPLYEPTAG